MHIFLLFSLILVTGYCAPVTDESQATILSYDYNSDENGNYNFSYSTSNGIFREEQGTIVNKGEPNEHIEVRGSYYRTRPDGNIERIGYTADENGVKFYKLPFISSTFGQELPAGLVASLLGK